MFCCVRTYNESELLIKRRKEGIVFMKAIRTRTTAAFLLLCMLCAGSGAMHISAKKTSDTEPQKAHTEAGEAKTETQAPLLSPAIRILAARTTMKKNSVIGSADGSAGGGAAGDAESGDRTNTDNAKGAVTFSRADFANVLGYTPSSIVIESLPDKAVGTLKIGTMEITEHNTLSASAMEHLRFVPNSSIVKSDVAISSAEPITASFTFTASGKAYSTDTALTCMLYLLPNDNSAPSAKDLSVTTYTEVPLYGSLCAADPEADEMRYAVVRAPKKGKVTVEESTGAFVYTPDTGKRGSDVFTYRVYDEWGNEGALCRVSVNIRRAGEELCYADLTGHWSEAPAMLLTERGIMTGSTVGEMNLFSPEGVMTRGEFLVCAMRAAGYEKPAAASVAMFEDAESIPDYMKNYVGTAYNEKIISGTTVDGSTTVNDSPGIVFNAAEPITRAEAAVIVQRLFGIEGTDDTVAVYAEQLTAGSEGESVPAWSVHAVSALQAAGILSQGNPTETLDRAQTAVLLASAINQS